MKISKVFTGMVLVGAMSVLSTSLFAVERAGMTPAPAFGVKAPAAPKPDLTIINQGKVGGTDNQLMVQIKNNGADNPQSCFLQGLNYGQGGGGATSPVPPIKAGQTAWVKLTFHKVPPRTARMKLIVDYNNKIAESNENNNVRAFNWK
ncbi:MAG: CARDB domain-containing protein [Chromatiales bacterium]|jgi:hypothetical protein